MLEQALRDRFPSLPFIWWAIALALTAGFGQGALLFLHLAAGQPMGLWWIAASQAHGHVQLFGWGGMFALGVGLNFLPRLRGCPGPPPAAVHAAAGLMGDGLALRALCQPTVAATEPGGALRILAGSGLALSGLLELAGAGLAAGALVAAARKGPPLVSRSGLVAVMPFALSFFVTLLLALVLNAVSLVTEVLATGLVPAATDRLIVQLGLGGMLVSISAAVSARTFPLYLRLRVPPRRQLYGAFSLYLAGFLLRATSVVGVPPPLRALTGLGAVLLGLGFLGLVLVLDVPLRRTKRTLAGPARAADGESQATAWLIVPAYAWLGVAGLLLLLEGLATWTSARSPPPDAERHALGVGLVTLLILGMAIRLLPGFAGRKLHSVRLVWACVWLANSAAYLRVVPLFLPPVQWSVTLLGLSGLLGLVAVVCLAWNLWQTFADQPVGG
jgi:uncharacterized protein involved in response to NO